MPNSEASWDEVGQRGGVLLLAEMWQACVDGIDALLRFNDFLARFVRFDFFQREACVEYTITIYIVLKFRKIVKSVSNFLCIRQ